MAAGNKKEKRKEERGLLIVFEGTDGTGKRTQAKLLLDHLKKSKLKADYIEFPQYETAFGDLVAKYLRGEFGELQSIPPEIPAILFALDRYQFKTVIEELLSSGTHLVANRYSESNLGYQAAKYKGKSKTDFIEWLTVLEERLPSADIVFYMHLPIDEAQKLIANRVGKKYLKGRAKDIHEQNIEYQKLVSQTYLDIAKKRKEQWVVINCSSKSGIRSKEELHEEIVKELTKRFKTLKKS